MAQAVIENPVLNSPYVEPGRHFRFDDEGITSEIIELRRISSYFVPIAKPKKKGKQLVFDTEWTKDREEPAKVVNDIRNRVALWRSGHYPGVTPTTARLLEYWTSLERENKLFFCQIEALETVIYITEAAKKYGDAWIENQLREANDLANPGLPRMALKMATGSGKTVVMAMLIAWHVLNKLATPQDARFGDTFLIVTLGITIRDRLRVLLPNDADNYYRKRDLVPAPLRDKLTQAKITITNFHGFQLREVTGGSRFTKEMAGQIESGVNKETPDQMVRRVCRELGNKKNIIVINDEAHHCYRRKPDAEEPELKGDERTEAETRNKAAHLWLSGIEAVKSKIGVKNIFDLSATPFFLRGSGYSEGTLFPRVVSDFSLIDAIESGIVKIPRVPVSEDSMQGDSPTYRDLWLRIGKDLPRKGRRKGGSEGIPDELPRELQGALHTLYGNYEKYYQSWMASATGNGNATPPVFIVVCNNTSVSELIYKYVAGWEKELPDGTTRVQAGKLERFRNDDGQGGWLHRPNTILVDSEQLESGEAMRDDFKKIAAREIDEFKHELRERFPGRDIEQITDEDLLREEMNTVGKPGKLGEHVRCVVSVSMLTEGWDANTVTYVLGVRAFGTQLLREQVVGRALRRMSYVPDIQKINVKGKPIEFVGFAPEYAEVYGVPFSFIPCAGSSANPQPRPQPTRVRALEERIACEITFPRLDGYRYELPREKLTATFTEDSRLALSAAEVPTRVEVDPIVGEKSVHKLDDLKRHRDQYVAFVIAKRTLERYFRDDDGNDRPWLFPQLLSITRRWLDECVTFKSNTFIQMLLLSELTHDASDRIYRAIVKSADGTPALKPILRPYESTGSTRYVNFDTTRPVYATRADKCHISHVVADTDTWEQKMAQVLEDDSSVIRYVKNHNLGFTIPYTIDSDVRQYTPDFIAVVDDGHGPDDPLNLIVEVSGEARKDKAAKVATARELWVPSINNHGGFGRWDFIEIADPWDARITVHHPKQKERS